jgi:hypothetical protein
MAAGVVMDTTHFVQDTTPYVTVRVQKLRAQTNIILHCQPTIYYDRKNRHDPEEEGK